MVTDYTSCGGGLTPESWARKQVGSEAVVSRELYAALDARIPNPRYAIRYYENLPEGEVPQGTRRGLSNFWGYGLERDGVTVLEVYKADHSDRPYLYCEIIDDDMLWIGYDGWLFRLQRKRAKGPTVPLKERWLTGGKDT